MKVRDVIKAMENDGWLLSRTRGDHRQYIHPKRKEAGTVTVPGHPADDLPAGTLNSILKKAGLKK
jgi:predicted RNA binding protein YcfA (HicA-like mRNA interferase family)